MLKTENQHNGNAWSQGRNMGVGKKQPVGSEQVKHGHPIKWINGHVKAEKRK